MGTIPSERIEFHRTAVAIWVGSMPTGWAFLALWLGHLFSTAVRATVMTLYVAAENRGSLAPVKHLHGLRSWAWIWFVLVD